MNINDFLRVAPYISECPNCGSDLLENGMGTFEQKDDMIKRTCECGFHFEYDVKNGTTRAKVKKAVEEALSKVQ